jgi:OOP family OmpA-OmpF porin
MFMKIRKVLLPMLVIGSVGVAVAAAGCHADMEAKFGDTASASAAPPPPPPPTPPASTPPPAETAPPPPPAPKVVKLKGANVKNGTQIDMPGDIEYATGSAKIVENDKSKAVLNALLGIMKDNPNITKLRIEGHTDDQGGKDYNKSLSDKRAASVADWLAKNGIDKGRLVTIGWGMEHPLVPNTSKENRAQNRRTEFHLQELDGQPVQADSGGGGGSPAPAASTSASPASSSSAAPGGGKPPTGKKN